MTSWLMACALAQWVPAAAVVPEAIRAAVEDVESHGRADVVSSSGCVGLMQVCPRWSIVPRALLFEPQINRLEGVRLLAHMHRAARGNWSRALAAYRCGNAGLRGECGQGYARLVLAKARMAN